MPHNFGTILIFKSVKSLWTQDTFVMSLVICFTDQTWELNVLEEFKLWHFSFPWRIMCTSVVVGRSIPSIDLQATFNQSLAQHLINNSINTQSTLYQHVDWHLIDTGSSVGWYTPECRLTHMYQSTHDQLLTEMLIKFWLRVLINTRPWMPLVHMIPWYVYVYFPGMTHTTDNCCHLLCLLVWV